MQKSNSTVEYLDNTLPNVWTLNGLAEWDNQQVSDEHITGLWVLNVRFAAMLNSKTNYYIFSSQHITGLWVVWVLNFGFAAILNSKTNYFIAAHYRTLDRLGVKHHVHCDTAFSNSPIFVTF
ncbi:16316_t:CDS:2, partial [Funneliformis geosporum]